VKQLRLAQVPSRPSLRRGVSHIGAVIRQVPFVTIDRDFSVIQERSGAQARESQEPVWLWCGERLAGSAAADSTLLDFVRFVLLFGITVTYFFR